MAETESTKLVVIGGGPGGYAAAFHAADLGMEVALVDANAKPGGVCLHRGCIPSKALLHLARLINEANEAAHWGLTFAKPVVDIDKVRKWKEDIVGKLTGGVLELCKQRKVRHIPAQATFADANTLELRPIAGGAEPRTRRLAFEHAILATGSHPVIPPPLRALHPRVMDSTAALELPDIPDRLLIVGGGYIGLELGCVYAALGSAVTVVEMTDGLLPGVDRDLVRPLQRRLSGQFKAIHLQTKVAKLAPSDTRVSATLQAEAGETEETFARVLIAVGRRPNSKDLGLDKVGVRVNERGFVEVNQRRQTSVTNIFAIGDVAGEPMLAHKASREGKVAVEAIAGEPAEFDNVAIPAVVFTDPEIAWCGLTEAQAAAENREVTVSRFPWAASGRAMTLGRTEGLTKLVFDAKTERVLGVGIVGVGAGELIAEGVLAVEMAAVARDLAGSIHAHPTLSETLMESAEAFLGHATHIYRPKRK